MYLFSRSKKLTFTAEKALLTRTSSLPVSRFILSNSAFTCSSFLWSHAMGIPFPPRLPISLAVSCSPALGVVAPAVEARPNQMVRIYALIEELMGRCKSEAHSSAYLMVFIPPSHANIAYRKQLPPQWTAGTIGSEWHESTPSKETTRPARTSLQSTKNQPIVWMLHLSNQHA